MAAGPHPTVLAPSPLEAAPYLVAPAPSHLAPAPHPGLSLGPGPGLGREVEGGGSPVGRRESLEEAKGRLARLREAIQRQAAGAGAGAGAGGGEALEAPRVS